MMRLVERPKPAAPLVRAQRKAAGPGAGLASVPRLDGGRPIDAPARSTMEQGFGRDFSQVRIHDGPPAAQSARDAGALAYTAGQDIVFGAGQYAPSTTAGRALLAHELAHTVQQGGIQHKAEGPPPAGTDHALEAEADRTAAAISAGERAPSLSRMAAPALLRTKAKPAVAAPSKKSAGGKPKGLPPGYTLIEENPEGPGAEDLTVWRNAFVLPLPKGKGPWVNAAYKNASDGGGLVFTTSNAADISPAAWKEEGSSGEYKRVWLANLGFTSMEKLGTEIKASTDPAVVKVRKGAVATAIDGMESGGLEGSGFDVDHIVEKQIAGTSIPTNLQLLPSKKNQDSGTQTYNKVKEMVAELTKPEYRPNATRVQIRFKSVTVPADSEADPAFHIETFLRAGKIKSDKTVQFDAQSVPVALSAGGKEETVRIGPDETKIDIAGRRIVPGMRLKSYKRVKAVSKKTAALDEIAARLDSGAIQEFPGDPGVKLTAAVDTSPAAATEVGGLAKSEAKAAETAGERRKLAFKTPKPKELRFNYPFLSPGKLTQFDMAADGSISGTGVITPTLKFLPAVTIAFGPDKLEATALDAKKFKSPVPGIRFTEGQLKLVLADASGAKFEPSGTLKIAIGPAAKPVMLGSFEAFVKNNALAGKGELTPAQAIPGIKEAKGEFTYDAVNGWAGKLTASSAKIPNSTVTVAVGFRQEGDKFVPYAEGGIITKIRDKSLTLDAKWGPSGLVYTGELDWPKPFPIVSNVNLKGRYGSDLLSLDGATKITYRGFTGDFNVHYRQKDNEAGKLYGDGSVHIETKNKKAIGDVKLAIDDAGSLTGEGSLTYALTDKITPKLGVKLTKGGHLTILGSVKVSAFQVFQKWPEKGGERELIKASTSFKIPTPIPAVNAAINVDAGVGISYGMGPGMVTGIELTGQFDPLEDNPNIVAQLKGQFVISTYFGLTGKIGARIGVEVAGGAVGVDGGVTVRPSIGVSADAKVDIDAKYEKGAFDFLGKAYIDVTPVAKLGVDLTATMYAGWHLLQYEWSYPVAAMQWKFPAPIKINMGQVGYSTAEGMRWPKLSDISVEPKDLSPMKMMQDVMAGRKTSEKAK
jgi:hypothetical protein